MATRKVRVPRADDPTPENPNDAGSYTIEEVTDEPTTAPNESPAPVDLPGVEAPVEPTVDLPPDLNVVPLPVEVFAPEVLPVEAPAVDEAPVEPVAPEAPAPVELVEPGTRIVPSIEVKHALVEDQEPKIGELDERTGLVTGPSTFGSNVHTVITYTNVD